MTMLGVRQDSEELTVELSGTDEWDAERKKDNDDGTRNCVNDEERQRGDIEQGTEDVNDNLNDEFELKGARNSDKLKWYQKLRLRQHIKHNRKIEHHSIKRNVEFKQSEDTNDTKEFGISDAESPNGSHAALEEKIDDYATGGKETAGKNNLITMQALGIYGLLTPAIAAVPATDEFDTIHKQIKDELGEDWELRLAAAHIDDALRGRGKYGKARSYFKSKLAQRCFNILDNKWYKRFFLIIILIHSLIIFIEPPSCEVPSVHVLVYISIAICLLIYIFDLVLRICFLNWKVFWSNQTEEGYWNGVQFLLVCLFWVDFVILCTSVLLNLYLPQPFRCLRLVMLLCRVSSIRHIFEVLAIIGTSLLKVLFIIFVFIITFACIGVHLYMNVYNTSFTNTSNSSQSIQCCVKADSEEIMYKGAFDHIGIAILRLFVLLSTENYPEIMLPALRSNSMHFFFFGIFVFFGGFFLTAILLAIVVDSYWIFAKRTIKKERAIERAELAKAWNLLDPLGSGALSVDDKQFKDLFRILKPKCTDEQNLMLIHLMDSQGDGEIDSFEWTTTLREALNAEFEVDTNINEEELKENVFNKFRKTARFIAEHQVVSRIILCLILSHGLLFCLKWRGQSAAWESGVHGMRTVISIAFMIEILFRIIGFGKQIFNLLETLDIIMVCIAITFNCIYYVNTTSHYYKELCVIISSLAILIRWMLNSSGPRKAFRWFLNIVPVMFDLVVLLFVILYLLATIAMEIFHHHNVPTGNQIYPDSCGLGFKNFWCSFLMMFQTLTTSNWHEIMNLVHGETKNPVAYFFFPLSYLVITMVIMNLFVAIAIEAANKLTSKLSTSSGNLIHQTTYDSVNQKPRPTFNETARKILASMAKSVIGSARAEDLQDRNNRQPINSPVSTATMTLKGSRKGSATIILSPPSKKREEIQKCQNQQPSKDENAERVTENEDVEEEIEDYSGLSPKAKREKQLKNKMKMKRKARQKARKTSATIFNEIKQQVRAIASFRGSQPTDLDFIVGDTITVIATRDEWMQGECKGVTGWFPASHVVNWSAKVLHESKMSNQKDNLNEVVINEAANETTTASDANANIESGISSKRTSSLMPQSGYRIKMKSGDWRREILGDITVMNAEEMRELNKVMRAELRAPGTRGAKPNTGYRLVSNSPNPVRRDFIPIAEDVSNAELIDYQLREGTIESLKRSRSSTNSSNEVFTADKLNRRPISPESSTLTNFATMSKDITRSRSSTGLTDDASHGRGCPTVSVSQLTNIEFPPASDSLQESTIEGKKSNSKGGLINTINDKEFLAIETPSSRNLTEKNVKGKSNEMPEWAKKFAETKNINVQNVSFSESTLDDCLPGSTGPS